MAAIQRLAKQAFITFRTKESPTFPTNFEILKNLLDNLTAEDINLEVPNEESGNIIKHPSGAPVSHIGIYECPYFSMGVFIVKKGCEIPLHDHPGMYGLCKVLYGKLRIRSYNLWNVGSNDDDKQVHQPFNGHGLIQRKPIRCQSPTDYTFDAEGGTCILSPKTGNYHSVHAVPGPTAFLDILAPPYEPDKDRDCTYYKDCDPLENSDLLENGDDKDRIRWLIPVNAPRDFYCDSQKYMGPDIEL
ncbi:2-aminoethanethiol dioxygenase-like isoform X2 [Actinia tenebrosa]|uniref:2-aminoethanethiol dioxygenase-like isoform X2 n=1 Tax=Actinia tenebrosa TaxID=6105 RepID=A0A6P8IYF6_ACTTE|nr:2-aminoethanethiol dioxygenase-like isoform X2 [Actinia tenebrosa]